MTFVSELAAGDPTATRTVYLIIVALAVIGVVLIALAVWVVKQTRPDRELLAPLELMGDRGFRNQDPLRMRRALDEVRPDGAEPVARNADPPDVDEEFAQRMPTLSSFDDLVEASTGDSPDADDGANGSPEGRDDDALDDDETIVGDEDRDDDDIDEADDEADDVAADEEDDVDDTDADDAVDDTDDTDDVEDDDDADDEELAAMVDDAAEDEARVDQ